MVENNKKKAEINKFYRQNWITANQVNRANGKLVRESIPLGWAAFTG